MSRGCTASRPFLFLPLLSPACSEQMWVCAEGWEGAGADIWPYLTWDIICNKASCSAIKSKRRSSREVSDLLLRNWLGIGLPMGGVIASTSPVLFSASLFLLFSTSAPLLKHFLSQAVSLLAFTLPYPSSLLGQGKSEQAALWSWAAYQH